MKLRKAIGKVIDSFNLPEALKVFYKVAKQ
jgi:hypothetical protein